jgi:hypothetical protein
VLVYLKIMIFFAICKEFPLKIHVFYMLVLGQEGAYLGLGAQFGGKHFVLYVRVVRLPRHGASCPVGIGVSCSADRQIKAKITREGIFIETLEENPSKFLPLIEPIALVRPIDTAT